MATSYGIGVLAGVVATTQGEAVCGGSISNYIASQMAVNSQRQLPHNALCHRPHTVSRRAAAAAGRVQVMAVATRPPATGTVGNVERKDPDLLGSRRSMVVPVYLCATVSFRGLGSGGYAGSNSRFSRCNFFVLLSVGITQSLSTAE
jgi:hypothetical protein